MPDLLASFKDKAMSYRKLLISIGDHKTRQVLIALISELDAKIESMETGIGATQHRAPKDPNQI